MDDDFVQIERVAPGAEMGNLMLNSDIIQPPAPPQAPAEAPATAAAPDAVPVGPAVQGSGPDDPPRSDPRRDCHCAPRIRVLAKAQNPLRLEEVFETLGREYKQNLIAIRSMVMSLAKAQDATQSQSGSPAPDVEVGGISSEDIFALKKKMTLTLARAVRTIDLIPGFFVPRSDCKLSIAQHLETLVSTQESLRTARDSIDSAWREAKKLFEARDKLIRAHENILHRRAMVKAVRWASIITLPFMPFLSGVLSVVEMSMAVSNGVQESFVTDDELLSTTSGVNDLHDKLLEQIKKLDELRAELVPVIAKVTEQRDNPLSPQLLYLRAKLKSTTQIVEAAFHRRTAADHRSDADEDAPDSCRTLREAIQAMHAIMPMLGLSITRDVSLASVSDEAWQRIEAELVKYKVSATY